MTEKMQCDGCKGTGLDPESFDNDPCKKCSGLKELDWIQNITGVDLTRSDKSILFVIQALNKFAKLGLMTEGGLRLDERAKDLIKDFKPTKEEMKEAVIALKREGHIA